MPHTSGMQTNYLSNNGTKESKTSCKNLSPGKYFPAEIHPNEINKSNLICTPCKAEQPLQGMELQKKKAQKIKANRKSV